MTYFEAKYLIPTPDFFVMTTESRAPEPVGAYPYTRRVGNLLFLSGVGPRQRGQKAIPGVELDGDGNVLRYDFESQCRAVFQNVRYIVEEAGAAWDDLVDVTVFLTNMKDDFPTYNRLYAEYFLPRPSPAVPRWK